RPTAPTPIYTLSLHDALPIWLNLGATRFALPQAAATEAAGHPYPDVHLAVFGAHMSGLPLNSQLAALGGRLIGACRTAPCYRLQDRKSTRLNSSHVKISYAVF